MKRLNVVYALIGNEDHTKLLLVKNRDNGEWSLPGGVVEEGETLDEALLREVKEETGLEITFSNIVAVNEAKLRKYNAHAIFFTFRAEVKSGEILIEREEEITAVEWIDLIQAYEYLPYYQKGLHVMIRKDSGAGYFNQGVV